MGALSSEQTYRLTIRASNRLEVLAEDLISAITARPLGPFERETIVVQSQVCARWLTLALARARSIAANLEFPLPRRFCHELADRLLGETPPPAGRGFDRDRLVWAILADMQAWASDPELAVPVAYLSEGAGQRKRYQLARQLATLFDRYQVYRPDLLLQWESGRQGGQPDERWQAHLWRRLVARLPEEQHLARRLERVAARLQSDEPCDGLPPRVFVFAVARLAPVVVELLVALSRHRPVTLYLLAPTPEYWGDLRSERALARLPAAGALQEGNELLGALGKQGREFLDLLVASDPGGGAWSPLEFVEPPRDSLLHVLQHDIFEAKSPRERGCRVPIAPGDRSLEVHSCATPVRELEVVKGRILHALERDPTLRLDEIAILVPDVKAYAHAVEAVFGSEGPGEPAIPVAIPENVDPLERSALDTLIRLVDLAGSRVTLAEVLGLLESRLVREAFGITAAEAAAMRAMLERAAVRWGIDGEHRCKQLGLPPFDAWTWRAGLDRLLMGQATGELEAVVAGVAPLVSDFEVLEKLVLFCECVFEAVASLRGPHGARAWGERLSSALERFCASRAAEEYLGLARASIAELVAAADLLGGLAVEREVVREHLQSAVETAGLDRNLLSGAVTFGSLEALRGIPFRLLFVCGLDAGGFPRRDRRPAFDLMGVSPRPCDRNRSSDDRYAFLEAILAARERLVLTYCGRSMRDGSAAPPSAVVSELLEQVDRTFEPTDDPAPSAGVLVEHPLHSFSSRYFDGSDPRLWSYSKADCAAAAARSAGARGDERFVVGALAAEPPAVVELGELVRFWQNPCRYFCREVLGLQWDEQEEESPEDEPLELARLERYRLGREMIERRRAGPVDREEERRLLAARGLLPPFRFGDRCYENLRAEVEETIREVGGVAAVGPIPIEIAGSGWRLCGEVRDASESGIVRIDFASFPQRLVVGAWIELLALVAARAAVPLRAEVRGRDKKWQADWNQLPIERALTELAGLIEGFREGLQRPLPVFCNASYELAEQLAKKSQEKAQNEAVTKAVEKARQAYRPQGHRRGDIEDPYVALCFRGVDPFAGRELEEAIHWARLLWGGALQVGSVSS